MKHLNADKYNLAWFKLAECVSRGEKERALGIYRLLSHSIGDDALACQVHGDLFLSFDEQDNATEKYLQAVQNYKKQNKIIEAIAVYEHLIVIHPQVDEYMLELCVLYKQVDLMFRVFEHIEGLEKNNKHELAKKISKLL